MIVSISNNEIERLFLVHNKKLQRLLRQAEERIRHTGGIQHDDLWSQLDAEYTDVQ